jgi:P27 family predicted phage terminase small subunit
MKKTEGNKIEIPLILQNNKFGKIEFIRLFEEVLGSGKVESKEEFAFITYCAEYGNYVQFELDMQKEGSTIIAGNGTEIPNPKHAMKQSSFNAMMKAAMQIGITPKSRIKSTTKAKLSKLDLIKEKSKAWLNIILQG